MSIEEEPVPGNNPDAPFPPDEPSPPSQPIFHDLHRSIVTVMVGPSAVPFYIHAERAISKSPYFHSALTGSFSESFSRTITLDDVDVDTFQLFEEWLYTGTFPGAPSSKPVESSIGTHPTQIPSLLYIKAYCFGDRVQCPRFQNLILSTIRQRSMVYYIIPATVEAVQHAWENTLEGDPLRGLMSAIFVFNAKKVSKDIELLDYPPGFVVDVLKCCIERLPFRLSEELIPFEQDDTAYRVPTGEEVDKNSEAQAEAVMETQIPEEAPRENLQWGSLIVEPELPVPDTVDSWVFGATSQKKKKKKQRLVKPEDLMVIV